MSEVLILGLLAVAGLAVALWGAGVVWSDQPARRVHRGLRVILGSSAQAVLMAPQRGRGVGFNFQSRRVAVAWETGGWGLVYGFDALQGADIIVDGQVIGTAFRGAAARPLDPAVDARRHVALRLRFDDPVHSDFILELWRRRAAIRRDGSPPGPALAEAAHWLTRLEAILNRPAQSWWEAPPEPAARPAAPAAAKPRNVLLLRRFADPIDAQSSRDEKAA